MTSLSKLVIAQCLSSTHLETFTILHNHLRLHPQCSTPQVFKTA